MPGVSVVTRDELKDSLATLPGSMEIRGMTRGTAFDGATMEVVSLGVPPGVESPWHVHEGDIYFYVIEGEGAIVVDGGGTFPFKADDFVLVPAGARHLEKSTADTGFRVAIFSLGTQESSQT